MVATLPATGKATWTNRVDNWRSEDTDWIQDRLILRYAAEPTPATTGRVYFDTVANRLRMQIPTGLSEIVSGVNFLVTPGAGSDTSVTLGHKAASGAGLAFTSTELVLKQPLSTSGDQVVIDPTGISIKTTASMTAKLTTDAVGLKCDKPFTAASFVGNLLADTGINAKALTATTGSFSSNVSVAGTTSVGVLNVSTSLAFSPSQLGSLINLYAGIYTIGIQSGTLYFRSNVGATFKFYEGGAHTDATGPGAGGLSLMELNQGGVLLPRGGLTINNDTSSQCLKMYTIAKYTSGVNAGEYTQAPYLAFFDVSGTVRFGYIQGAIGSFNIGSDYNGIITFLTESGGFAERMRLHGNNLLIGKTAYDDNNVGVQIGAGGSGVEGRLQTCINNNIQYSNIVLRHVTAGVNGGDAANRLYIIFQRGTAGATMGFIRQRSQGVDNLEFHAGTGGIFVPASDYRYKDDLGPIEDPIGKIMQLRPRHLRWNDLATATGEFDGFIAHEVTPVAPYAVSGEKDAVKPDDDEYDPGGIEPQGVDYGRISPVLTAGIQEHQLQLEDLTQRVEALENLSRYAAIG